MYINTEENMQRLSEKITSWWTDVCRPNDSIRRLEIQKWLLSVEKYLPMKDYDLKRAKKNKITKNSNVNQAKFCLGSIKKRSCERLKLIVALNNSTFRGWHEDPV